MKKITIQDKEIAVRISKDGDDYISLTDMAKFKNVESTGLVIAHWLSTKYTIQFMGIWEQVYNQNFNVTEFSNIKNEAGSNGFMLSSSAWIKKTGAIGIRSSPGRYGGTFAHKDIAFEFATWLSPEFKLYLIKEFQRLKNEADVLNKALFGMTAKEWRKDHPKKDGNIRDYADVTQLVCLANLENLNAEYIREGLPQGERLLKLNTSAISQMKSLMGNTSLKKLGK